MAFLVSSFVHPYLKAVRFSEVEIAGFPTLDRCPACGSAGEPLALLDLGQPAWRNCVHLVQCGACDHVFYRNPPAPDFFAHFYSQVWNSERGENLQSQIVPSAKVKHQSARLTRDLGLGDISIRILEIGCGHGAMLAGLEAAGYRDLYGTEASDYRAAVSNKRFPGRIFTGGYESVPDDLRFDFIYSNHVLEHIYDPRQAFAWMTERLRPGGVIAATVPDAWGEPIMGQVLFLPHLHSFCHRSLVALGRNAGLDCLFWKAANMPYEASAVFFKSAPAGLARDRFEGRREQAATARRQTDRIQAPFRMPKNGGVGHYAMQADEEDSIRMSREGGIRRVNALQRLYARAALPVARFLAARGLRKLGNKRLGRIRYVSGRFVGGNDRNVPVIGSADGAALFFIK